MISLKAALICVLGFYLLAMIVFSPQNVPKTKDPKKLSHKSIKAKSPVIPIPPSTQTKKFYKFNNLDLAYNILSQLDTSQSSHHTLFQSDNTRSSNLLTDKDYCLKHRAYFIENPEYIFEKANFVLDPSTTSFIKKMVIPSIGKNIQPNIDKAMKHSIAKGNMFALKLEASIFYSNQAGGQFKEINQDFSCLTQVSNYIPGADHAFDRRDTIAKALGEYANKYKDRSECFNKLKFSPQTFILSDKKDCQVFFKVLNSKKYKELNENNILVFTKKTASKETSQEKAQLVTSQEEVVLKSKYENGKLCGKIQEDFIMQRYIQNPLLINGHKFYFRNYMLVASTNPLIAYYHDGFVRQSLVKYNQNALDKEVHLPELSFTQHVYDFVKERANSEGMNENKIKITRQWSFERLQEYLIEAGIVTDPKYIENHLKPQFKRAMIHLLRSSASAFMEDSSLFGLFSVDFLLDEELNLWFIEADTTPQMRGFSQKMEAQFIKMLQDQFEIVIGLLRSRTKRIINHVNKLIDNGIITDKQGKISMQDIEWRRVVFGEITKNYFEKEFEPSFENGFEKMIDENLDGVEVYQGLLSSQCL